MEHFHKLLKRFANLIQMSHKKKGGGRDERGRRRQPDRELLSNYSNVTHFVCSDDDSNRLKFLINKFFVNLHNKIKKYMASFDVASVPSVLNLFLSYYYEKDRVYFCRWHLDIWQLWYYTSMNYSFVRRFNKNQSQVFVFFFTSEMWIYVSNSGYFFFLFQRIRGFISSKTVSELVELGIRLFFPLSFRCYSSNASLVIKNRLKRVQIILLIF